MQWLPDGEMNNVDFRPGFPLAGQAVALVTASIRTNNSLAIYRVNPATRQLENAAARTISLAIEPWSRNRISSRCGGRPRP